MKHIKLFESFLEETNYLLKESESSLGSYKTRIGDTITTMSFTIKDSTLMLSNNGALVCQWTINPKSKESTDRDVPGFLPKLGSAPGNTLFNSSGQMVVDPTKTTSGVYGLDKSLFTALSEVLDAQPDNSPWKTVRKATNQSYSESMLSRFKTWTSKLTQGGMMYNISTAIQFKFTGVDKKPYSISPAAYYRMQTKDYIIYFTAPADIKTPQGGISDKSLQTAIQKSAESLGKMNRSVISDSIEKTLISDMTKNILPKIDALVKQL
jgi:hypothetical protein